MQPPITGTKRTQESNSTSGMRGSLLRRGAVGRSGASSRRSRQIDPVGRPTATCRVSRTSVTAYRRPERSHAMSWLRDCHDCLTVAPRLVRRAYQKPRGGRAHESAAGCAKKTGSRKAFIVRLFKLITLLLGIALLVVVLRSIDLAAVWAQIRGAGLDRPGHLAGLQQPLVPRRRGGLDADISQSSGRSGRWFRTALPGPRLWRGAQRRHARFALWR